MISWTSLKQLQSQKLDLEVKLNEVLQKPNRSNDEVNELKSEILYLDKKIGKIVGSNEIKRQNELKRRKSGIEQRNIKNYYAFKDRYKKISKMRLATTKMISIIENFQKEFIIENEERIMVKK